MSTPSPSSLFSPIKLRSLELANRLVIAPMCQYSADDGSMTDWHMYHVVSLANSGAGLVIVEATGVEPEGRITHGCTALSTDANEASMKRVLDSARRNGPRQDRHPARSRRPQSVRHQTLGGRHVAYPRGLADQIGFCHSLRTRLAYAQGHVAR